MHILLIHQAFTSLDEAGGTRHYEIARFLVQHDHSVTVITSPVSYLTGKVSHLERRPKFSESPFPGLTILRAPSLSSLHRSFVHRVISFISFMLSSFFIGLGVKNVDLIWGTTPPIFQGFTAWLLARLKNIPFQLEVRDLWPAFAIAVGVLKNPLLIGASLWLETFLYTHADWILVNSPGFIPHLTNKGAKNITLIANGVDTALFNPAADGAPFRQRHGLQEKFIVLYAGAHGLSNDLDLVLLAAGQLRQYLDIQFVFVGDGKEKPALQASAQAQGLDNVHFVPPVPKNEMPGVLASANACLAILKPIDLYRTTYPNKVFDYMAAARPVILAIDGVIRHVVEEAHAGIFVEPGNASQIAEAVLALHSHPDQAAQMGQNGRQVVESEFKRNTISEKYLFFLNDVWARYERKNTRR